MVQMETGMWHGGYSLQDFSKTNLKKYNFSANLDNDFGLIEGNIISW